MHMLHQIIRHDYHEWSGITSERVWISSGSKKKINLCTYLYALDTKSYVAHIWPHLLGVYLRETIIQTHKSESKREYGWFWSHSSRTMEWLLIRKQPCHKTISCKRKSHRKFNIIKYPGTNSFMILWPK